VQHISLAKEHGLLSGVMFSGCSGVDGPYGSWKDAHMPHCESEGTVHFAEGSLMSGAEIRKCVQAAGGGLLYCGGKITAKHDPSGCDVAVRVGLNRDLLELIGSAGSA
jgi:hypothetical protein